LSALKSPKENCGHWRIEICNAPSTIHQGTTRDIDESAGNPQKYGIKGGIARIHPSEEMYRRIFDTAEGI
jgi:hypothetical protein